MNARSPVHVMLLAALIIGAPVSIGTGSPAVAGFAATIPARSGPEAVRRAARRLPVYFIRNVGQVDARVSYLVQGDAATTYFTPSGVTMALLGAGGPAWVVKQRFLGARGRSRAGPVAGLSAGAAVSYFHGSRDRWTTGAPTYRSIRYRGLWPGIDLSYSGTVSRLKYTFTVAARADPSDIRMSWEGATSVALAPSGALEVRTPARALADAAPIAWQTVGGRRFPVAVSYELGAGGRWYGFRLGRYDPTLPLVIDPAVIAYSGYIGGHGYEDTYGIGVDARGEAFLAGATKADESTFPVKVGPELHNQGNSDAFVCKVSADGTELLYCGYIGGSRWDRGRAIAVDPAGHAYVVGHTKSSREQGFPATVGPDLTQNGDADAFICKVSLDGSSLDYCGYIGGLAHDEGKAVAVDGNGYAYVTGGTHSDQGTFPVKYGPDVTFNGASDVWVAKVKRNGTGLVWCGYIGGAHEEHARGIDVDPDGSVYVGGSTASAAADGFPVLEGPDLVYAGNRDGFVAKVRADGSGLDYAGYIGGTGVEEIYGLRVDDSGEAYVAGSTSSGHRFPAVEGPDLTYNGGPRDAFISKVSRDGTGFVYSGFVGGDQHDGARGGVDIDGPGHAYITGGTRSTQATFPAGGGPDDSFNGGQDAFVCEVDAAGSALVFCGYIGGTSYDEGRGVAVDASGAIYVGGSTGSNQNSFPVAVGPALHYGRGITDGFVTKIEQRPAR